MREGSRTHRWKFTSRACKTPPTKTHHRKPKSSFAVYKCAGNIRAGSGSARLEGWSHLKRKPNRSLSAKITNMERCGFNSHFPLLNLHCNSSFSFSLKALPFLGVLFVAPRPVGRGAKFPLYHTLDFLSIGKVNKYLAAQIPKLVQHYHLIFLKFFAIIYLQGKERTP